LDFVFVPVDVGLNFSTGKTAGDLPKRWGTVCDNMLSL